MKANLYKIECLTNLHMGSGDINYNIIDNEVEKDPVLLTPTIHASGIKGALREYFEVYLKTCEDGRFDITKVFGGEVKDNNGDKKTKPGEYKFLSADLIARPLRVSKGNISYIRVTTVEIVCSFIDFLKGIGYALAENSEMLKNELLNLDFGSNVFLSSVSGLNIEGEETGEFSNEFIKTLIGENYAIAKSLTDYELPVLARNQLEKGESKNLWYEEVVPHKSIFYFVVLTPDDENLLSEGLQANPVQFGGNASIGYGYTDITEVKGL